MKPAGLDRRHGRAALCLERDTLAEPFRDTRAIELQIGPIDQPILHSPSAVSMGNPHAIFWVDDADAYDLGKIGPAGEPSPVPRARQHHAGAAACAITSWFARGSAAPAHQGLRLRRLRRCGRGRAGAQRPW